MLAKPTLLCAIVAIACAAGGIASSQTFPNRPIRIVVGFAPAGPADVMARLIGQHLTSILGQGVVIDNRPGAGGTIGARAVAESDPDGYTLLLGNTSTLVISPLIYKNVNYDPVKGFAAIAALGTTSNLLIVNPALPVKSVGELVALARAHPGKLNYASAGIGTPPHLIGEMFKQRLNLDVVHVPYKGAAPALQDVIAGHVQMMFATASSVVPHIRDGKVRPLAVATLKRTAVLPDIPTIDELGIKNFDVTTWHGLVAPAHTPKDVIATLNRALAAALDDPDAKTSLAALGVDVIGGTPEEFAAYIKSEIPKWAAIIKASGAKPE